VIVFLHGFTSSPRAFDALRVEGVEGYAAGLLGHEVVDPSVDSFEDEVDRLAAVVRRESSGDEPIVVGYSLGGRLALGLAARHPNLFRAVVAIGAHPGLADPLARAARRDEDEALAAHIESIGVRRFVAEWETLPLFASQRKLSPAVLAAQRATRLSRDPQGLARSLRTVGLGRMPDLRAALAERPVPLHLVTGSLDDRFTALAAELACASHTIVSGVGHNVLLERPDRVAALIRDVADVRAPGAAVEVST
jgi:2-succinyl-6-hydroxy-2,4-cyclohexadiene-1-carboxylate synthase